MSQWYYESNGQQKQCSGDELREKRKNNEISDNTLIWCAGMESWQKYSEVSKISRFSGILDESERKENPYAPPEFHAQVDEPINAEFPAVKPLAFWKFIVSGLITYVLLIGGVVAIVAGNMFSTSSSNELKTASTMAPELVGVGIGIIILLCVPFGIWHLILFCQAVHRSWRIVNAISPKFTPRDPTGMVLLSVIPVVNYVGAFIALPGIAERWEAFRVTRPNQGLPIFEKSYPWIYAGTMVISIIFNFAGIVAFIAYFMMVNRMCKIISFTVNHAAKKSTSVGSN